VQANRNRGDDGVGACANCCGEQWAALVVQDSVASAPRFDVGEQTMTNRPFSTWVRTKPTVGATRVRCGLGRVDEPHFLQHRFCRTNG
jgi:hypothetical protein